MRHVVGVADAVPELGSLATELAPLSHAVLLVPPSAITETHILSDTHAGGQPDLG
jgi:hypothetical protein